VNSSKVEELMPDVRIVHIFHNCFVLKTSEDVLVFDVPAEKKQFKSHMQALEKEIIGQNITVFISHSHSDHFDINLRKTCSSAASLKIIASDDILDMYPDFNGEDVLSVEPDAEYHEGQMSIKTLVSNDLGVAFIITLKNGLKIYFGGDLAQWDWEEAPEAQRNFAAKFFKDAVSKIAYEGIDIGFSNVDRRLSSLAGAPYFAQHVKPNLFIPMHAFGRTAWLEDIDSRLGIAADKCFIYRKTGDFVIYRQGF
jgi:hypothetical protein